MSIFSAWLPSAVFALCLALAGGALAADLAPPALLLARIMPADIDPTRYLVSEKLDGVRAVWDGRELRFRSGRKVPAPGWFVAALPPRALDGELWLGRGRFDALSAIVRREVPDDAEWRQVRYMIFELPGAPGSFTERAVAMRQIAAAGPAWLHAVEQLSVVDRKALERTLREVVRAGGEGLMLHLASGPYETGRSDALLKLKPMQDAEATVVGHLPGKGKYQGMTGALLMRMPAAEGGHRFRLGSGLTDALRRDPPPVGSLVTYRYTERTARGVPRFPRYWRLRAEF